MRKREFFKTCKVHTCFSADLNEPFNAKKCRCRKWIGRDRATKMVEEGEADWLMDYSTPEPTHTWHVTLKGRAGKTPRAHTIEKAHIERGLEKSDDGALADFVHLAAEGAEEAIALWDAYHETEMLERCLLFRKVGLEVQEILRSSDTFGELRGATALQLDALFVRKADELKGGVFTPDPWIGRAIMSSLGGDQRTCPGKTVKSEHS